MKSDLDTPLYAETQIFRALTGAGWNGNVQTLRLLAHKGEALRQRNENACNYVWATSEHYEAGTKTLAREIAIIAQGFGLCLFLQGDCRGVPVYVGMEPLDDQSYERDGQPLFWQEHER
jgi:hypothetical protein